MNIFFLDRRTDICAQYHSDQHVVKMCLETAQIICTALSINGVPSGMKTVSGSDYRPTHKSHPCVVWAAQSKAHVAFLYTLGMNLCREFEFRFGKKHACEEAILTSAAAIDAVAGINWSDPPQCMPDIYKVAGDPVAAYRRYYNAEKAVFAGKGAAKWTKRETPPFMNCFEVVWSVWQPENPW